MPNQVEKFHYDPYKDKVFEQSSIKYDYFNTHFLEAMPGVSFIPYPEMPPATQQHIDSQMRRIDPNALFSRRLFVGQFWNYAPVYSLQLMVDMYDPEYPGSIVVRRPDMHRNSSHGARGSMHVIVQFYRPVNVEHFVSWLHQRFLYDRTGFWMATTPEGLDNLNHYVTNYQNVESHRGRKRDRNYLPLQCVVWQSSLSSNRFVIFNRSLQRQLMTDPGPRHSSFRLFPIESSTNDLSESEEVSLQNI
jgi:hypothetical protein